jgi:hypothetical protein
MATFPTLSTPPVYPLPEEREDRTIASPFEAGYRHTRTRYTKARRTWGPIRYENIYGNDVSLLDAHVETVHECADMFTWNHPVSGQYNVRFKTVPKKQPISYDGSNYLYTYEFTLIEV